MTISSTSRKSGPYTGNAVTTAFPFVFKVFATSDVVVVQTDLYAVETTLVLGVDYTVVLNSNQDSNPGGTVNMLSAPIAGYLVTLTSAVQNLQPVVLTNGGGFYPQVISDALDRVTIQIQQLAEQLSRTLKIPISSTGTFSTSITNYVSQAAAFALQAAASAGIGSTYSNQSVNAAVNSASSANAAAASASAAASSAQAATTPTVVTLAAYLDNFFPSSQLVTLSSMYLVGGWDLGGIVPTSSFTNETALRRASMSGGSGTFNFGTVP